MQQTPSASTPTEVLAGLVERVTFHNEENGFCVLRVKARGQRDLITVIGHAAVIAAGEWVTASGEWVNDRTHGQQFRSRFMRTSAPTSSVRTEADAVVLTFQGSSEWKSVEQRVPIVWTRCHFGGARHLL